MPDYNQLRAICQNHSRISKAVIDDNLLYYAANRDKPDQDFERRISPFSQVVKEMPSNWKGLIKAQFIAHRIFKAGGLISKYLKHSAMRELKPEEGNFLKEVAHRPWRFSFAQIAANPATDFYEMEDVFSGEVYLLHSPSISRTLQEHSVLLWHNLIGHNGSCYQSFGPVIAFRSFSPDDIFFCATELNPTIESDADMTVDIDEDPVRYMMLAAGSNYPLIESRGHEVVQVYGEGHSDGVDVQVLKNEFTVEYAGSVFRLRHPVWSEPPHSSEAYIVEASGVVSLTALTDAGYQGMSLLLNRYGWDIPTDPDIRIHLPILTILDKLFKKRPELNPYAQLFESASPPESEAMLAKLNQFMAWALPYINAGNDPDVDELAKKAGVEPDIARSFLATALDKVKEMRK